MNESPCPDAAIPKPSLGVLFVTSAWMREVKLQAKDSRLSQQVELTAREVLRRLSPFCDVVAPPVACSAPEAAAAARTIAEASCDLVMLAPLVWCEDKVLRAAWAGLGGLPLILATVIPHPRLPDAMSFEDMLGGSSVVGTLQASGMLFREGCSYVPITGWCQDPVFYAEIDRHARACAALRRLRNARIGLLPFRCDAMSVTWIDEFALRSRYGTEIVHLDLDRAARAAQSVAAEEVSAAREEIRRRGIRVCVDERSLDQAIRFSRALDSLAQEERLSGLAINDLAPELHRLFGLRPCLPSFPLSARGVVVTMEADVCACVAMHALRSLTGHAPFYSEIFNIDIERNCLLMGHAGYHDPVNGDPDVPVQIVADEEYRGADCYGGAAIYFKYRPGPITAVNCIFDGKGLRWSLLEGESLPGPAQMPGNCHLVCRLDQPVASFLDAAMDQGVSQHWIVVPGLRAREIGALRRWLEGRIWERRQS